MNTHTGWIHNGTTGRIAAIGLALLAFTACDKSATTPTPTAASLVVSSGNSQTATVASALAAPIVVQVLDASGQPVAGVSVSFVPAGTSGAVSAAQAMTDVNGSAQVSWTLGTAAGTDSLVVTAGALAPTTILATATAGVPASISILAGNDQSAGAGSALPLPLSVLVADQYGNPVPNAAVSWTDDAGGLLASTTTLTDANGVAQDAYTLAANVGAEDVTASVATTTNSPAMATFLENGM